jgi:tRNA-specific 2-thiouridylase
MKVAVALSGGVDSSVAAALLLEQGHEVVGITLQQWPRGDEEENARHGGCCSLSAVEDARRVAGLLGIPYYVWNLEREFDAMATGHYARVLRAGPGAEPQLHAGVDPEKDQSYVLYHLDRDRLATLLFPLGEMTKGQVRALATRMELPVANKKESMELCFVPPGETASYLQRRLEVEPGDVVDQGGQVLGRHRGAALFTVGQRSGLGQLSAPGPWFVRAVETGHNRVVVGRREELATTEVELESVSFVGRPPQGRLPCQARLRYHARPLPATYEDGRLELAEPFFGAAPGQAAVMYEGSQVLGGGTIRA